MTLLDEIETERIRVLTLDRRYCRTRAATVGVVSSLGGISLEVAEVEPPLTPNISRLVRESGRPVPRHVATSITVPSSILPRTNFCPSGKSITSAFSEGGTGIELTAASEAVESFFDFLPNETTVATFHPAIIHESQNQSNPPNREFL
jgi:hypothetical protein